VFYYIKIVAIVSLYILRLIDIYSMKFLIADDHHIVRKGIRKILIEAYPEAWAEEALTGSELLRKASSRDWSLIITDITMPGISGLEALKELKKTAPKIPVLILSMHAPGEYAFRAIKSGAAGYLTKDSAAEELILAVQTILKGKRYITSEVAELIADSCTTSSQFDPLETLTDKEFEIFKLLVSGKKAAAIANNLSIRQSSIAYYRGNILQKMHVQSNNELIRYAIQHNIT